MECKTSEVQNALTLANTHISKLQLT